MWESGGEGIAERLDNDISFLALQHAGIKERMRERNTAANKNSDYTLMEIINLVQVAIPFCWSVKYVRGERGWNANI